MEWMQMMMKVKGKKGKVGLDTVVRRVLDDIAFPIKRHVKSATLPFHNFA